MRYRVEYDNPKLKNMCPSRIMDLKESELTCTMDVHAPTEDAALDLVEKMTDADPMYMYATLLEEDTETHLDNLLELAEDTRK